MKTDWTRINTGEHCLFGRSSSADAAHRVVSYFRAGFVWFDKAGASQIIHVVNNIYSSHELTYRPRWITPRLQAAIGEHRIVVLTGARQVGKSTLLRRAEP